MLSISVQLPTASIGSFFSPAQLFFPLLNLAFRFALHPVIQLLPGSYYLSFDWHISHSLCRHPGLPGS